MTSVCDLPQATWTILVPYKASTRRGLVCLVMESSMYPRKGPAFPQVYKLPSSGGKEREREERERGKGERGREREKEEERGRERGRQIESEITQG